MLRRNEVIRMKRRLSAAFLAAALAILLAACSSKAIDDYLTPQHRPTQPAAASSAVVKLSMASMASPTYAAL